MDKWMVGWTDRKTAWTANVQGSAVKSAHEGKLLLWDASTAAGNPQGQPVSIVHRPMPALSLRQIEGGRRIRRRNRRITNLSGVPDV